MSSRETKTIFMPIFHGHISRNVLLTNIFKILADRKNLKIVIFTYDFKKDYYQKEFGRDNVIIEGVDIGKIPIPFAERIFKSLFPFFVDSPRVRMMFRELLDENHHYPAYYFKRILAFLIGNSGIARRVLKKIYFYAVPPKKMFLEKFKEYKPNIVFLPDATFSVDTYILRAAKTLSIPSVATLRSFDTITSNKGTIRIHPDLLLVHNKFMRRDAVRWCGMDESRIIIAGMPHFDYYVTDKPSPREEFFRKMGLNPSRRVILFALTGPRTAGINQDIVDIISKAIDDGRIPEDTQLLVRMHPNSNKESFKKNTHAIFHRPEGIYFSQGRLTDMEFTREWLQELLDTLNYSDVTINPQSTMSVDAVALDKPVINLAFDGYEKLPYVRSVARLYVDYSHYVPIVKSGGVRLVYNEEELINWINRYLGDQSTDREGRRKMLDEQCYKFDGKSAERTAGYVLKFLGFI